jgi:hypothetical protein
MYADVIFWASNPQVDAETNCPLARVCHSLLQGMDFPQQAEVLSALTTLINSQEERFGAPRAPRSVLTTNPPGERIAGNALLGFSQVEQLSESWRK